MENKLYEKLQRTFVTESDLKVGDTVRVTYKPEESLFGMQCGWVEPMDAMVGNSYKVECLPAYAISINGWNFPFYCLEKVETPTFTVKLNSEYTAEVSQNGIKVGCQEISLDAFDRLVKAVAKVRPELRIGKTVPFKEVRVGEYAVYAETSMAKPIVYEKIGDYQIKKVSDGRKSTYGGFTLQDTALWRIVAKP